MSTSTASKPADIVIINAATNLDLPSNEKNKHGERYKRSKATRAVLKKEFSLIIEDATLVAANAAASGDGIPEQESIEPKATKAKLLDSTRFEKHSQLFEVLILIPLILVIIGLFLIPTVFYALPNSPATTVRTSYLLQLHDTLHAFMHATKSSQGSIKCSCLLEI